MSLDVALQHHADAVTALSQELEQSAKLTEFAEVAAAKLNTKYAAKIENRREVIKRLGMRVELGLDDKNRYADMVFIASGISPIRNTLRIACASLLATDLPRTIFRKRFTLPRKRIRRNTRSAS